MRQLRRAGFTLIELVVVVAVAAAMVALATPNMGRWSANQRAKAMIRSIANTLSHARGEAIRSGNNYIVFFRTDAQGNALANPNGDPVPVVIVNDDRQGAALQNCQVDAAETAGFVAAETGIAWGVADASTRVPTDFGSGGIASGSSFTQPNGTPANWVLFRSDGMPVAFSPGCVLGGMGSGAGAIYITNGSRDYAAVLTPLGRVRVHGWDNGAGQWTN